MVLAQLLGDDGVVLPEDEGILTGLVLGDAELGCGIVLHLVVVAVQVVGRDVEQHGHIGLELIHVVELKTAQLNDIHVMMLGGYLQGDFAHDGDASLDDLGNHGGRVGDARALDHLIGVEDLLGRVSAFLPRDAILVEQVLVGLADGAGIAQPHVHALDFAQHGCSRAALAATQHY